MARVDNSVGPGEPPASAGTEATASLFQAPATLGAVGRIAQFRRNAGWSGMLRSVVVLGLGTVVSSILGVSTGDWTALGLVIVSLAVPVFARESMIRHLERTVTALRYFSYSLAGLAFAFPFVQDHLSEGAGKLCVFAIFSTLSLYISAYIVVHSDPRVTVDHSDWQ